MIHMPAAASACYPGGRGSEAAALGTGCLGFTPSVVTAAPLSPTAPAALCSPGAGDEEDEDEVVVAAVAPRPREACVVEAAAVPLAGLAASEVAGEGVDVGGHREVVFGAV